MLLHMKMPEKIEIRGSNMLFQKEINIKVLGKAITVSLCFSVCLAKLCMKVTMETKLNSIPSKNLPKTTV